MTIERLGRSRSARRSGTSRKKIAGGSVLSCSACTRARCTLGGSMIAASSWVRALAVASEPSNFWDGTDAAECVARIPVPAGAGTLEPADSAMNGPSGPALDEHFLKPLGTQRSDTWLCDLVPHTCLNPAQARALAREYEPRAQRFGLPPVDLPAVPKKFADRARAPAIVNELEESGAEVLVLLGDAPIAHWLHKFDARWKLLSDFGDTDEQYGRRHAATIAGRQYEVLPLAHPRQLAALGSHSPKWRTRHEGWRIRESPRLPSRLCIPMHTGQTPVRSSAPK